MSRVRIDVFGLVLAMGVTAGCDLPEDGIGPEGGVVLSQDGRVALEIPAGALEDSASITIEVAPTPEGAVAPLYVIEPMGLVFLRPTALVFDYDDQVLGERSPDSLSVVAHRELDWAYLPDKSVDADDQTVTASLMALSPVTVVAEP